MFGYQCDNSGGSNPDCKKFAEMDPAMFGNTKRPPGWIVAFVDVLGDGTIGKRWDFCSAICDVERMKIEAEAK